jgi:uncharacterized protein YjiS (DUF1127 family)
MSTRATFLKRIMNSLVDARERAAQRHIRQYLRGLGDRHLEDIGISGELVEQGPKAWPWRMADELHGEPQLATAMRRPNTDSETRPADQDRGRRGTAQADQFGTDDKLAA